MFVDYEFSIDSCQHHHDMQPMPNDDHIVYFGEEPFGYTRSSASSMVGKEEVGQEIGEVKVQNPLNQMWSEAIFEIEMVGTDDNKSDSHRSGICGISIVQDVNT